MSYLGNQPTTTAFVTDTFNGNGSTTAFTMSVAPASASSALVAISGVVQDPSTYSVVGTTLTFSAAPPSGTGNISVRYLGIPASGVTTTAYRTVADYTATAGQTTFTPASYTPGFISVFHNGVRLGAADYTATNGTTVVLATAAASGDLVTIESFQVSSVLNAIPNTAGGVAQSNLATGVAGTGPAFSAYPTNPLSVSASTETKVVFPNERYDTAGCFDTTNSRFTPNVAGYYWINGAISTGSVSWGSTPQIILMIKKNGGNMMVNQVLPSNSNWCSASVSQLIYMNGTTDYVELYAQSNYAISFVQYTAYTEFAGVLVRAA